MESIGLLLRAGAQGEAVRDVQRRLRDQGYAVAPTEEGVYADETVVAIRTFQEARGLRVDGICGPQTWSALVEAGYALGDRLLYHRSPMLRGDDVANLQRRLSALGFDTGRIDGIFGPQTARAVADFQRNSGLTVDGACGPATVQALARLGPRTEAGDVVASVREVEALRRRGPTLHERRVVVGETGGLAAPAHATARALGRLGAKVVVTNDPDESVQARYANDAEADIYIGIRILVDVEGCSTLYYANPVAGTFSPAGQQLASRVQAAVAPALGIDDLGIRGLRIPILRETRMPAVVLELGPTSVVVERSSELAARLAQATSEWTSSTCP